MRNTYIVTWIILLYLKEIYSQCSGNDVGENNPKTDKTLGLTNTYYLICDTRYTFDCCGVLNRWRYEADLNEEVELQVWRPTGVANFYRLVGSTSHTEDKDVDFNPTIDYLVRSGDCLGWHSAGADVIGYKDGGTRVTAMHLPAASVNTAGDVDWSGATTTPSYEWAIGAQAVASSNPTFSGPLTGSIDDAASITNTVVKVAFTDSDTADELTLEMSDTYFDIIDHGDGTASITVKSSLNSQVGSHTLLITAEDLCQNIVTGTVVVTVTNTLSEINGLDKSTSTPECVTAEVRVSKFTCTDNTGIADASITESPAHTPPFFFVNSTGLNADEYGIYVRSQYNASLGQFNYYDQREYIVTVHCDDGNDVVTESITVNLLPNTPPVITNLPANGTLVVVSSSATIGTTVFKVNYNDAEGDVVNVTYTSSPSDCPFAVLATGNVIALPTLSTFNSSTACDLVVGVVDKRNPGINRMLTIQIVDVTTQATTTATADRYKTFFDDPRNLVWFSLLMVLLAITTVVTIFVCCNYVCMTSCCKCPSFGGSKRSDWRSRPIEREYTTPPPKRRNRPSNSHSYKRSKLFPDSPEHEYESYCNVNAVRPHPPPEHSWRGESGRF